MKVTTQSLTEADRIRYIDALYTSAGSLKGRADVKAFLKDLLTSSERIMLGRRIMIAQKLLSGEEYDDIVKSLRVGSDTIARVHQWLRDQYPGYERALEGFEKAMKERKIRVSRKTILSRLKKRYPLHFLLWGK